MREIVTLQLGHLSNYAATHFWNAQESYFTYSSQEESPIDHDVHWRPGLGADGAETFLPRTVIYDLKGGFGSLRKINALYEPEPDPASAASIWGGTSVLEKQTPIEPSAYQQSLDAGTQAPKMTGSSVRYWSDFSRVYYHPKSLVQLYDFELNSSIRPFERHEMGTELFETLDKEHEIVDRDFRPFVEECDRMQGIQAFATLDDAWGGFACKYLDALRDEYPKSCIWLWGLSSPTAEIPREKRQQRISNTAQAIGQMCQTASMVVPMSIPETGLPQDVTVDPRSPWNTSALLASAFETATLESRMTVTGDRSAVSMWDIVDSLNTGGNQTLSRLRMGIGSLTADLENSGKDVDFFNIGRHKGLKEKPGRRKVFGQLSTLRGSTPGEDNEGEAGDTRDPGARRLVGESVYRRFETPLKFPLLDSYPQIFTGGEGRDSIETQTTLATETSIGGRMKALKTLSTWSIPMAEREVLSNGLSEIADAYQDDWESGSDEDDDDL